MRFLSILVATALIVGALPDQASAHPPREVRLVATIDGVDELFLNARSARLVHHAWDTPDFVSINGQSWNPRESTSRPADDNTPYFDERLDLAGASATLIRGRGDVAFRHEGSDLVLTFDDGPHIGAGEYEVLVEFADTLLDQPAPAANLDSPLQHRKELLIEARIDGRDELHLGPQRANWLHLHWSWPTDVRIGGTPWDIHAQPLDAPDNAPFFPPGLDLSRVTMSLEEGRGAVELDVSEDRLFLVFDDGDAPGADDYVVRLTYPTPRTTAPRHPPSGELFRVLVVSDHAADVAGATLLVHGRPLSDRRSSRRRHGASASDVLPVPGMRGMTAEGRCVLALPAGVYRFEVLHRSSNDRLVALRSASISIEDDVTVPLHAGPPRHVAWQDGRTNVRLDELTIHSMSGTHAIDWQRSSDADIELIASRDQAFSIRACGTAGSAHYAWWSEHDLGDSATLRSNHATWTRCTFRAPNRASFPADCTATLHAPLSTWSFPVRERSQLFTNRRSFGLSYSHAVGNAGRAVFHPAPVVLPERRRPHAFELGGAWSAQGSAAVLENENLGRSDAQQLWWDLHLTDPAGRVVDTEASDIGWRSEARMVDGSALPAFPLNELALTQLAEPASSIVLHGTYERDGTHEVEATPETFVALGNSEFITAVPRSLHGRARSYLDKARRVYHAIEAARGRQGDHSEPIELKWWMNHGAVGVYGSITMPIQALIANHDRHAIPWALAHETLHGFGYHHSPELDRIDAEVIAGFERDAWNAERQPDFVPDDN